MLYFPMFLNLKYRFLRSWVTTKNRLYYYTVFWIYYPSTSMGMMWSPLWTASCRTIPPAMSGIWRWVSQHGRNHQYVRYPYSVVQPNMKRFSTATAAAPNQRNLVFRQLFDRDSCTYTYLLADATTREGVLIDPVDTLAGRDMQLVEELGLELKYASKLASGNICHI